MQATTIPTPPIEMNGEFKAMDGAAGIQTEDGFELRDTLEDWLICQDIDAGLKKILLSLSKTAFPEISGAVKSEVHAGAQPENEFGETRPELNIAADKAMFKALT